MHGQSSCQLYYLLLLVFVSGPMILRRLFSSQPSLEHGISVAFGLVWVRAMRARAEGWAAK